MGTKTEILQIKLEVDGDGQVKASLAGVEQSLSGVDKGAGGITSQFNALKGAVAALGLGYLAKQFLDLTDSMDRTAKSAAVLNITTESLTSMANVFRAAGAESENLDRLLLGMTRRITEAGQSGGETALALRQIGLSARELRQLAPDAQFELITAALGRLKNEGDRAQVGNAIFIRDYQQVARVVAAGTDAMAAAKREAIEFGAVLSTDTARKAELFNDNLGRMGLIARGMGNALAEAVLPSLIQMSDQFVAAYKSGGFLYALFTSLGGISIETAQRIQVLAGEVANLRRELAALDEQGIGSIIDDSTDFTGDEAEALREKIAAKEREIADLKKAMERNAEIPVPKSPGARGGGGLDTFSDEDAFLRQDEAIKQRIITLDESLLTEQDRWQLHYDQQQMMLEEAFVRGLITEQQQNQLREQLEIQHQAKLGDIESRGLIARRNFEQSTTRQQTQFVLNHMLALTQGVAQHNRTLFEINKIAGIANAIVNAYEGISLTMKTYPYPWNIGMAALHAVSAFAQVSAIQSTSFGGATAPSLGGSGAGSVVATVPASDTFGGFSSDRSPVAEAVQAPPRREINITFIGSGRYTYDEVVNGIVPLLNEATDNGVDINVRAA